MTASRRASSPPVLERFDGVGGVELVADRWVAETPHARGFAVLAHGGGQTRHAWRSTGSWLASRGWETIAYDARGHGDSGWSRDSVYAMDQFAGDLARIVAALPAPPVLIGASLGGTASMLVEGRAPGSARAIVLVDVAPRLNLAGAQRIQAFMRSAPDGFATLEDAAERIHAYNPHRQKPPSVEGLKKNLRPRDGRWFWHWDPGFMVLRDEPTGGIGAELIAAAARNIECPVMLVRGTHSDVLTDQNVAESLEIIPHLTVAEVDAGHMVAGDDNRLFTRHIGDFLDGV